MTRVALQPAGDPHARRHYADTVESPVPMKRLQRFLPAADIAALQSIYGTRPVPTWGVTSGAGGVNASKWERLSRGDAVLMARDGRIFMSGVVTHKSRSQDLARDLWGSNELGHTWECLYFLDEVRNQALSNADLNLLLGYKSGARVQGFNVLDEQKSALLLDALGLSLSDAPVDARALLENLRGQELVTLGGRTNRVLALQESDVIVATTRSPEGQPVPLELIQSAIDRLLQEGEVLVTPEAVGYRSGFVGAVLRTLPGVRIDAAESRVRLPKRTALVGAPTEAPEVADARDAVAEMAGLRRHANQGRRQSAEERRVIEEHAVALAIQFFREEGWHVEDVGRFASYDLDCHRGSRALHVEVKGTTSSGTKILLTPNEVQHALESEAEVALYVVAEIILSEVDGQPHASSGRPRVLMPWAPAQASLQATGYEYRLPD